MNGHALKKRKLGHGSKNANVDEEDVSSSEESEQLRLSEPDYAEPGTPKLNRNSENIATKLKVRPKPYNKLAASGDMYHSDLFQIQVGELLKMVQPNYEKQTAGVETVLRKLKHVIEISPSRRHLPILQAQRSLRDQSGISIPFPEPGQIGELKYSVAYEKPERVDVVGSFVLKTAIKKTEPFIIDLAITIPSTLFQQKDYLDHRYFNKRAYYLACVAANIQQSPDVEVEVQYDYHNSNPLQPVILVTPVIGCGKDDFSSSNCHFRVLLALDPSTFPVDKTLPWKSCIRHGSLEKDASLQPAMPTPVYNATIRSECSTKAYLRLLHSSSKSAEGLQDACKLATVWLRQRGFETGLFKGGFGAFEAGCTLALLLRGGGTKGGALLSSGYSSYQLFKSLLQFLATADLIKVPMVVGELADEEVKKLRADTPVLFDAERGLNILWKMSAWSYKKLRHEARLTLELLNKSLLDRFRPTFISRVEDPLRQYDLLMSFPVPNTWNSSSSIFDANDVLIPFCKDVYHALSIGLDNRVHIVHFNSTPYQPWSTNFSSPSNEVERVLTVGLLVNPDEVNRAVDRGPPADDKVAAAAFRKFWGERAELRRFEDGSIIESLVWAEKGHTKTVLEQVIHHILERHISSSTAESINLKEDNCSQLLPGHRAQNTAPSILFRPTLDSFERLSKQMRELEGLPLQIRQISASCSQLRYTSVLPPAQSSSYGSSRPMDITVQFEGSNRWPEDLSAVQKTKIAFLLKMGELLEEANPDLTTRLGLENDGQKLLNGSFLDIICSKHATFRLRIHHELELSYLTRNLIDKSLDPHSREEAARAISFYKRTFIQSPLHTQALHTLCTRFQYLSPSIRLMKQWCASHLLSGHISEELVELLTTKVFLNPYPWTAPGSLRTAFLRTLSFIARWDWRSEPLTVDLSGVMAATDFETISTRFEAWRKIDPALNRTVLFAASNLDPEGITWTAQGPSKVVAARLSALAKAACATVKQQDMQLDVRILFAPSLADYDWVIHINRKFAESGFPGNANAPVFKNLQLATVHDTTLVGYEPVQLFIRELESVHGKNTFLFYNSSATSVIAGLWNPQTGPRPWKVNLSYSTIPSVEEKDDEGVVSINKTAILNDIAQLGGDLISRIDVKQRD